MNFTTFVLLHVIPFLKEEEEFRCSKRFVQRWDLIFRATRLFFSLFLQCYSLLLVFYNISIGRSLLFFLIFFKSCFKVQTIHSASTLSLLFDLIWRVMHSLFFAHYPSRVHVSLQVSHASRMNQKREREVKQFGYTTWSQTWVTTPVATVWAPLGMWYTFFSLFSTLFDVRHDERYAHKRQSEEKHFLILIIRTGGWNRFAATAAGQLKFLCASHTHTLACCAKGLNSIAFIFSGIPNECRGQRCLFLPSWFTSSSHDFEIYTRYSSQMTW